MAISQTVEAINVFGGSTLDRRTRSSSSPTGTTDRYTMSIKSQPILTSLDPLKLGQGPALAIRDLIVRQIKGISLLASESTQLKRKYGVAALAAGAAWARARYSGGRTGTKDPNKSSALFNDSGRLVEGLELRENKQEGTWTVNSPANRFSPDTFRDGEIGLTRMIEQLVQLAPALGGDVLGDQAVVAAIAEASADAIFVLQNKAAAENRAEWQSLVTSAYKTLLEPLLLG